MLQLVLMMPLAVTILDFVLPWPWRRFMGEAPTGEPHEEKLEKLLNTINATFDNKNATLATFNNRFYTDDYPYDPYNPHGGQGGEDALIAALMASLVFVIIGGILLCLSGLIFACQYKQKVTDRRPPLQGEAGQLGGGDFRTGPFSCFDDTPTCCHALFCSSCRAGDTYQAAGASQFWTVIGLSILAQIIGNIVSSVVTKDPGQQNNISQVIRALAMGGIFHGYRRKLRTRLGGGENAQPVYMDFLLWACCSCCVVAQEARELDAAMGVRVECCCNLQVVGSGGASEMRAVQGMPQVTGQPVGVYPATQQAFAGQPQVTGQPVYPTQ